MGARPIESFGEKPAKTVIALASCTEDKAVFSLIDPQLAEYFNSLISSTCDVRYVELGRECLVSGVKVSKNLPYYTPGRCFYVEIAQGTYVGILPGYIDAQCLVCGDEVRCRLSLQRRAYVRGSVVDIREHLDFKQVREIIEKLRTIKDSFWCLETGGSLVEIVQL